MKKIFKILLAGVMALTFTACSGEKEEPIKEYDNTVAFRTIKSNGDYIAPAYKMDTYVKLDDSTKTFKFFVTMDGAPYWEAEGDLTKKGNDYELTSNGASYQAKVDGETVRLYIPLTATQTMESVVLKKDYTSSKVIDFNLDNLTVETASGTPLKGNYDKSQIRLTFDPVSKVIKFNNYGTTYTGVALDSHKSDNNSSLNVRDVFFNRKVSLVEDYEAVGATMTYDKEYKTVNLRINLEHIIYEDFTFVKK